MRNWRTQMSDPDYSKIIPRLAVTPEKMDALDLEECMFGYIDGRRNEPPPGDNRTDSYVQGWWAGMRAGQHRTDYTVDILVEKAHRLSKRGQAMMRRVS